MLKQERSIDQMLEKNKNFNQVEKYFIKTRLQFVICHFILIIFVELGGGVDDALF